MKSTVRWWRAPASSCGYIFKMEGLRLRGPSFWCYGKVMAKTYPMALIYSPFPSPEAARTAAQVLLGEKLVACCNIVSGVESHYWWQGALTQSAEVVLWCKTTHAQLAAAAARLEGLHPYDCPAILTIDAAVNSAFAQWVEESVNL